MSFGHHISAVGEPRTVRSGSRTLRTSDGAFTLQTHASRPHQLNSLPTSWWTDAETLAAVLDGYGGSNHAIARATGVNESTIRKWRRRHGIGPSTHRGAATPDVAIRAADATDDSWLLAALKKAKDHASVEELADACDVSPRRVREAMERLGQRGYRVEADGPTISLRRRPTETGAIHTASPELFDGDSFRFGVTSDVHTSSKAERLDWWETAYDIFEREGITTVLDPGDLVDGMGIYPGQVNEVINHTYEDQVDHAAAVHPFRAGIRTQRIAGNHDLEGEFGRAGADPSLAVANQRDDIDYLGRYSARVKMPNGAEIHLLHPMGGASYAMSYRPQKIAESYEGGDKPAILLIGHWHRAGYFFARNIHVVLAGTFQGPTTYSTRKAFGQAGTGFWIIEGRLADDGSVVGFKSEWFPFYANRVVG